MSKTIFKLRMFGIAAFLLFFISIMFPFPSGEGVYFHQIQQILILVSFVIFAILILIQLFGYFSRSLAKEEEADL